MSLIVEDIRTVSPLTGTDLTPGSGEETSFLADNNGDIITVEIDVRFETVMVTKSTSHLTLPLYFMQCNALSDYTGKVQDNRSIYTNNPEGWDENDYHVGDYFVLQGMAASSGANNKTGQIIEISADRSTLITDTTFILETFPLNAYLAITTGITAITHKHGIIANSEEVNYLSKVDGSEQVAQVGGLSYTNTSYQDATMLGNKSWQSGSIQVKGNNAGNGNTAYPAGVIQAFTIKHEFLMNPLMLADEWDDILDGLKPDRLLDGESMRYVFSVDAAPVLKNPNQTTNVVFSEFEGNVGWFDENLNGGINNYSVEDLVYTDILDVSQEGLELTTSQTKITFTLKDNSAVPNFSDEDTKMIFGFNYAPSDKTQYRDINPSIQQTMEYNFMFDNVISTVGMSSGTPKQFGTTEQVIESCTGTWVSTSEITVVVIMNMSTEIVTRLAANTDQRFQAYVSIGDYSLSRSNSDKVTLSLDNDNFFIDTSDPTMVSVANSFMEHTGSVVGTDNDSAINARAEDDIACITNFALDKNGRESDDIYFSSATAQIIAKNGSESFVLDQYTTSLVNLSIIDDATYGGVPFVDITQDRGFATPADALRRDVRIKRREDLDSGGIFSYELDFPIVLRWEDWEPLPEANDAFFDTSEPNNGKNEDWIRISSFSGWDIYYKFTLGAFKNGDPLTFSGETVINMEDYLAGTEWDTENIKTYIDSNDDPILSGSDYGISLYENTRVEADMTYLGAESYVPADLVSVLKINVYQKGNFKEQYTLSSLYEPHADTKWLGISPSTKVTITNPSGDIWRSAALLQFNKLEDETTYKITHRLYAPPFGDAKEMEDDSTKTLEDDSTKTLD